MRVETASDHGQIRNEGLSQRTTVLRCLLSAPHLSHPRSAARTKSIRTIHVDKRGALSSSFVSPGGALGVGLGEYALPSPNGPLSSPVPRRPPLNLSLSVLFFLTLLRLQWQRSTASLLCLLFVLATASAHKFLSGLQYLQEAKRDNDGLSSTFKEHQLSVVPVHRTQHYQCHLESDAEGKEGASF